MYTAPDPVEPPRTLVQLDASAWVDAHDVYEAALGALGAPYRVRRTLTSFVDAVIFGGITAVAPPFRIEVRQHERAGQGARDALQQALDMLAEDGALILSRREAVAIEMG